MQVTNTAPANGATNVPINATITLTFNDNIKPGPSYANITIPWSSPLTKTINGNTLTITPTAAFGYHRWVELTIPADALLTTSGTPMASTFSTSYTTTTS